MFDRLPNVVNPLRMAESGQILTGDISLTSMARLSQQLVDQVGTVSTRLEFGVDAQKICYLDGQFSSKLALICQRCMRPMTYRVDTGFKLAFVESESEAEQLPEEYEPCILEEHTVTLTTLIEDELMLSLPIVPMHDSDVCKVNYSFGEKGAESEADMTDKINPFSELEKLKTKR
ncbi:MAG: YceD family protein [Gammaproteobacteria bacterium]